jgi:hypothetical protein
MVRLTPDIGERWPGRAVKFIQTEIGGDEAVSGVQTNRGANECAIDLDNVRLQHDTVFSERTWETRSTIHVRVTTSHPAWLRRPQQEKVLLCRSLGRHGE